MSKIIPVVSLWDNLRFNLGHVIPLVLKGLFSRQKFWVNLFSAVHTDPQMLKFCRHLKKKYDTDAVYLRMLFSKSVLVLEQGIAGQVLANSPTVFGPAKGKVSGMSHFQPDAVTVSTGEEWQQRRKFNEVALRFQQDKNHYANIIDKATEQACAEAGEVLGYDHLDVLFENITLQIVFGEGVRDNTVLLELRAMMRQSNRFLTFKKSKHYDSFNKKISNALSHPRSTSLIGNCPHANAALIKPANQVPHWLFAMRDTLAENTACSLACLVSDAPGAVRLRALIEKGEFNAELEAGIQEAMRLWPTTPLLVRETLSSAALGNVVVGKGVQVILPNAFLHRDINTQADAEQFLPERWKTATDLRYNHLSNGPQVCVGKDLALFIAQHVVRGVIGAGFSHLQSKSPIKNGEARAGYNYYKLVLGKATRYGNSL
ncbi:MAG: cytochrome P450 [Bermanella sp.]|jgi:cytochrome P450